MPAITNTTADTVASARTSARIEVVNTSERYELAMINANAMYTIRNATRHRYGMKTEPNCYDANEQSTRYADVRTADNNADIATAEVENARKAYEEAVRAERHASAIASAINYRNDLNTIVRTAYAVARWIARYS